MFLVQIGGGLYCDFGVRYVDRWNLGLILLMSSKCIAATSSLDYSLFPIVTLPSDLVVEDGNNFKVNLNN